jgi:hypothetical protein
MLLGDEIHKLVEATRRNAIETDHTVMLRLLSLPAETGWQGDGVFLPSGTELRMVYRGIEHLGCIAGWAWHVEGRSSYSPSAAAGGCALTRDERHPNLNGWRCWAVKRPADEHWISLWTLRSKVRRSRHLQRKELRANEPPLRGHMTAPAAGLA